MQPRVILAGMSPVAFVAVVAAACAGLPAATPSAEAPVTAATVLPTVQPRTPIPPPTPPVAGSRHVPARFGEMEPGTYHLFGGTWTPVTYTFEVPAGWTAENGGQTITKLPVGDDPSTQMSWSVVIVEALFAEPCGWDDLLPVGPSADDFIEALRSLPGPETSDPVDIVVDGHRGNYVDIIVPSELDIGTCDPPGLGLQIWLDKPGGKHLVAQVNSVARVHVVDVEGQRFILSANIGNNADPDHLAEFEAILASIRFYP